MVVVTVEAVTGAGLGEAVKGAAMGVGLVVAVSEAATAED